MRCSRHGLALAPDGKCVRCRQEEEQALEAAAPPDRRRPGVIALLLVAGLGCAGVVLYALRPAGPAPAVRAEAPPPPALPAASAPPLDPLAPAPRIAAAKVPLPSASGPSAIERAAHDARITIYCRAANADCARARVFFLDRGYVYAERDVDADPEAAADWRRITPAGAVPAFDIDGQGFVGFDAERIQGALDYAGARRLQR